MALTLNSTFGNYRIGEVIGEGGMGQVYRATDTTLDREVAIKVLPESFAQDADRLARFEREAKTLASLNHNNIAQIFGLEKQGDTTAIVMELVEGPTLADRIAQGPLSAEESLRIAKQIIDGLEAAHDKGIVHRDLKPANIKVRADGLVKILDFGIAKPIDIQSASGGKSPTVVTPAVTETGVIMGTAAYMSPEQARGRFVDERTDIWAFGCVLFEMLTGQPAFAGEDVAETLARIISQEADTNSLPGVVSPMVRHTIELCLQKDVKKRLADIRDVRLGISGALESGVPAVGATGATKKSQWLPLVATVVVTAALSIVGTYTLTSEPAKAVQVAEIRRSIHTLSADQAFTVPIVPAVSLSGDGKRIAYSADGNLYVRNMDELEARMLPGTEADAAIVPTFSPDGQTLLYGSAATGELLKVSVEGGTPLPILPQWPANGWRWSGDKITYGQDDGAWEIDANGGSPTLLAEEDSGYWIYEPARIPGTDLVTYERRPQGSDEAEVVVTSTNADSPNSKIIFPGKQPTWLKEGYLIYFDTTLGIMARAFDPATLSIGSPIVMVSDIMYRNGAGGIQFRIAVNGTLLYERGEISGSEGDRVMIGSEKAIIRELSLQPSAYNYPNISPDGSQLVLQNRGQIYVYGLDDSSELRQLTRQGENSYPVWTPDGDWITYVSDRDGSWRIWRQRADGSGVAEALTESSADSLTTPAWAPDGRLTYSAPSEGGGNDIWIVSIPLGEPELLINREGNQNLLRFSPQGNAMAYGHSQSGTFEVMVEPFPPDGSSTRISLPNAISGRPVWSADGGTLYYQTLTSGGSFAAVDITVPGFALRNRRDLPYRGATTSSRLAVIPDTGELLLTIPSANNTVGEVAATELVIVENWVEEVKARVPRN